MVLFHSQADSDNLKRSAESQEDTNNLIKLLVKKQKRDLVITALISGVIGSLITYFLNLIP